MKKHLNVIIGGTLMMIASFVLASTYAFHPWSWKHQSAVYWNVSNLSTTWQNTFGQALQKWKNVPNVSLSLYLGSGNNVYADTDLGPGFLGKFYENTCWYDSSSLCDGSTIRFTTRYTFSHGTTIASGTYDAQWLAIHELGHSLGLAHPTDSAQIMYGSVSPATLKRTLQAGDITGVQTLY